MNSYARMERILRWLDTQATSQPTLAEMAAVAGLEESHFHHEFFRWTGVTPKDFVQGLTLADAKKRLASGEEVLEASIEVGLSGPGRFHDLYVSLEAATPDEIKSGGAGLTIHWGIALSPFGPCLLGETDRGICRLSFLEEETVPADLESSWPRAIWIRDDQLAARRLDALFQTPPKPVTLRAWVRGSAFQIQVWRALLEIPSGALSTYGRLATTIGRPGAARAVGTAVGSNPVAFLIPCHRVIRETGAISDYRWGVGRKRALLAWEGAGALEKNDERRPTIERR
jgi:AraC family transcriptional regulator of adaptative response/methylated-DNA-[protein]-cysteine methyltransferase